ncbi:TetR/AcrR family transcriptional regulator [Rhodococcus artemisiae]|uniref:TetR/AcrR family transcriptional regulator n=1 Tax=Rhodococcus artemisiae TaxID=714159 RepID=A0ABU7L9X9_9NOCA|nr:TetR/AcrR family transcriptional regulator [Rhodococcus artemisiae]MEE2058363.1 TetR/AcrR family transcriptional regulator [Rhodococcus artemisiae]
MAKDSAGVQVEEAVRAVRASSRRRQVLDAAVVVMQRTGFHQMSMQALADEAKVSVGLIYKYFGGKEEILLATIVDILDQFRDRIAPAMDAAGSDPIERLAAGFHRYVQIVDENLHAVALTYRESRTLDQRGRDTLKELEVTTSAPLRDALEDGVEAGLMNDLDVDLMSFDLMMIAHGWSLKHWHFAPKFTAETYAHAQLRFVLEAIVAPEHRDSYRHLAS